MEDRLAVISCIISNADSVAKVNGVKVKSIRVPVTES